MVEKVEGGASWGARGRKGRRYMVPFLAMATRSKPRAAREPPAGHPRSGWTMRVMTFEEGEADQARRYLAMTPAARVRLVYDLFAACLSTQGIREPPRLRRVYSHPESAILRATRRR